MYTSACIHHRHSFAAHTSGGPENSWSMSQWARAIVEAIVEPKRSSLPRVMGPSKILCDIFVCRPVMYIATIIILIIHGGPGCVMCNRYVQSVTSDFSEDRDQIYLSTVRSIDTINNK